jgi:phosphatidylserine/phosphatidylglycerophosphate/cardiolipin synthase-like enzyme
MQDIKQILLFIQTLHYRDDLENLIFTALSEMKNKEFTDEDYFKRFNSAINKQLLSNLKSIFIETGVLTEQDRLFLLNSQKLEEFIQLVQVAKASRDYKWPENKTESYIYVSPSSIINADLLGDVDDITNLIVSLVSSAQASVSLMSPFTNDEGLRAVLSPLTHIKYPVNVNMYFSSANEDVHKIYAQTKRLLPEHLHKNFKSYFCVTDDKDSGDLPHAKTIIVDSKIGYLGSANFTKQGLNTRFELGVKLNQKQCVAIEKMLSILIDKKVYSYYDHL